MHDEFAGLDLSYPEGATMQQRAEVVLRALKQTTVAAKIKREVKDEIIKNKYTTNSLGANLPKLMEEMGCTVKLMNCINGIQEACKGKEVPANVTPKLPVLDEALDSVREGKRKWRQKILEQLRRVSVELDMPYARLRTQRSEMARHTREGMLDEKDKEDTDNNSKLYKQRGGVFCSTTLLQHIIEIHPMNHKSGVTHIIGWGMIPLEVETPTPDELIGLFPELRLTIRQCGVDEGLKERFTEHKIKQFQSLLKNSPLSELRQTAKNGVPVSMRKTVWVQLLSPLVMNEQATKDKKDAYYQSLQQDVIKVELLLDDIVKWDIRECANDDKYFVFDEMMERVLLPLLRDPYCKQFMDRAVEGIRGLDGGQQGILDYPPSGIIPYQGLAALCAPLCFIFTDVSEVYFMFRAMFCRYWVKLQTLSSKPDSIITLSKLFEKLVQVYNPDVVYHCISLNLRPLELAFPWMFTAFSGYLEVDQVLYLWDRIIAYDTLQLLPLAAASIFLWRGRAILQCETAQEVRDLFTDFSKLQIIPLLQYFLFA
eukprot:TRINITY_DN12161_c0_g1_i1.p1 TRINITY_DN12161_c0_g1~~TRINITY_DN12161_c0_g1_i1.p1  ORF type:complete len:540 (+),score=219.12 TRINITY_DN12161_c0_g1_i1:51-1670(+)